MGCGSSRAVEVQPIEQKKGKHFTNQSYFIKENERQVKDNYIIKNKLGEGAFGTVRRIVDNRSGEEKAIKIISKQNSEKEQEKQLMLEIDILKELDHPSIIKTYEFYQDKKNYYIITELIKGGELFDKVVDMNQFSEADAAFIFNQLISVVQYSHEKKIMHRDLKPDNILLEYNPESKDNKFFIKVIDWGSATFIEDKK